ncbi:MAG: hypothetical protein H6636_06975 [Anaerolineales bacterium]|nr:hypothetical protein [Anaerolineales bacterium]
MSLPATDAFTGSDGTELTTYSGNWTLNSGNFVINTNALAPYASVTEDGAHWNADTFADDQYAQIVLAAETSSHASGVAVRCHASAATYYGWYDDTTSCYMFKMMGGTWTQLGAALGSETVGNTIKLEVVGTTLTYYRNGSSRATRTDSAISAGYAGVSGYGSSNSSRVDDWEGGNVGVAAGQPTTKRLGLARFMRPSNLGREGVMTFFEILRGLLWRIMFRMALCPIP